MPKVIDIDALFDAVVRVFADRGYAEATTQEMAARAGVNEVTLFRRYGTKAALVAEAFRHVLARTDFAELQVTGDVRADLVDVIRRYEATNHAYGGAVATLLTETPRHPELRGALDALRPNMAGAAHVVAAHQARGAIGPGNPLQKVALLIAPLIASGLWLRAEVGMVEEPFDPEEVVDAFLDGHRPRIA